MCEFRRPVGGEGVKRGCGVCVCGWVWGVGGWVGAWVRGCVGAWVRGCVGVGVCGCVGCVGARVRREDGKEGRTSEGGMLLVVGLIAMGIELYRAWIAQRSHFGQQCRGKSQNKTW